jgi:hypothetical protein
MAEVSMEIADLVTKERKQQVKLNTGMGKGEETEPQGSEEDGFKLTSVAGFNKGEL